MHQKSQFTILENGLPNASTYSMLKTSWLAKSEVSECLVPASTNAQLSVLIVSAY